MTEVPPTFQKILKFISTLVQTLIRKLHHLQPPDRQHSPNALIGNRPDIMAALPICDAYLELREMRAPYPGWQAEEGVERINYLNSGLRTDVSIGDPNFSMKGSQVNKKTKCVCHSEYLFVLQVQL